MALDPNKYAVHLDMSLHNRLREQTGDNEQAHIDAVNALANRIYAFVYRAEQATGILPAGGDVLQLSNEERYQVITRNFHFAMPDHVIIVVR